jgi:putative hydrolase of the HAD superfamily
MDKAIEVILFDLGNVLVDFDYTISANRISNFCAKAPEEIIKLFFGSELATSFEEGKISPEDFFARVKEILGLSLSYKAFVPIWNEVFYLSAKNRSVFSLANQLRRSYKVALLSNIDTLHYEYFKKHFPVFGVFHKVFASCELKLVKPHALIYQKALAELESGPENVFYIDDRPELVKSARELGINAVVFKEVRQLKADLLNSGVSVN